MVESKPRSKITSPEGPWRLAMTISSPEVANHLLPKIDNNLSFESSFKPATTLVSGEGDTSAAYGMNGIGAIPPSKTTKTMFTSGIVFYDQNIPKDHNSFKRNVANITERGKAMNYPINFSVIPAPYKATPNAPKKFEEKKQFSTLSKKTSPGPLPPKENPKAQDVNSSENLKSFNTNPNPTSAELSYKEASTVFDFTQEPSTPSLNRTLKNDTAPIKAAVSRATSSFISKLLQASNLSKWLSQTNPQTIFMFFNAPRSFLWVGINPLENDQVLARIDFSDNTPVCQDVNTLTRSESHLDIVLGFLSGDLMTYDPLLNKYERLNKNRDYIGEITKTKWIPGSENTFFVTTSTGLLLHVDRNKDLSWSSSIKNYQFNPITPSSFQKVANRPAKSNPLNIWKLSDCSLLDFSFSPDCRHMALVGKDGYLRVIDYLAERLLDVYPSYFGEFTCVAWSGDGKYILTGGKDDLVSIWSFYDRCLIARCEGHKSWITSLAFDTCLSEDPNEYRFASIGEDTQILFWDFSLAVLPRPKV
ncbi:hypothetical protein BB560_004931 [Smittium megazygosporum]|uniref:Uncharacterized protein n=1 Tax=Smittium megazygosporum TaxID=133381 RepID=A0A2T9Z808_9FUNG|nr:hypothetical protein BB560_004931 [Smittium megazygosporum]